VGKPRLAVMLVLSTLHQLLSQVLSHPHLHTAVLLTPAGELVSVASSNERPKDDIRVLVGLSGEIWRETKAHGCGMAESELGRIIVTPVDDNDDLPYHGPPHEPLLLVALNATESVEWRELHLKSRAIAGLLARPLKKYRTSLGEPATGANGDKHSSSL